MISAGLRPKILAEASDEHDCAENTKEMTTIQASRGDALDFLKTLYSMGYGVLVEDRLLA